MFDRERTYCASDSDRRVLCSVGKVDHEVGHAEHLREDYEDDPGCEEADVEERPKAHKPLGRHLQLDLYSVETWGPWGRV